MTNLTARGATVVIEGQRILDGVDLEVRAGEVLALVGPNGAGKSTLLSVLAGDRAPTSGVIELDGEPITGRAPARLARERAVLLQEQRLSFPFTVLEVVRMGRAPWRRTPAEDRDDEVVAAAMARASVTHLAHRRFPSLSGGEKARTSLARVLAQGTGLLFLDEPTAALDIQHQESVLAQARASAAAGVAVVVVLHDLTLAGAYADRIAVLRAGRVVADGAPADVLRSDLLSDVYGHPVDVLAHPRTGAPVVVPVRQDLIDA